MRERVKQDSTEHDTASNWYLMGSTYVVGPTPLSYVKSRVFVAMADVVTPQYKRLQSNGNIVNSPMKQVSYIMSAKPSVLRGKGRCSDVLHEYAIADIPPATVVLDKDTWQESLDSVLSGFSDESEIAQTKAWADIDVSEIQGAASLGELPETVNWLVDKVKTLAGVVRAIKRKDARKLKELLNDTKKQGTYLDLWLEYRYAIRPLVADITSALAALQASLEKGQRFTARGVYFSKTGPETSRKQRFYTNPALASDFSGYWADETTQTTLLCRAGVLVEIDHSINTGMAIWGLDNPLEAVWELLTLSFVIDWFINIGNVLSALLLNPGLSPRASWVSEEYKTIRDVRVTSHWRSTPYQCSANLIEHYLDPLGSVYEELTLKRRVPLAKRYSLPHLNVRLDPGKILDIYAIARNLAR